MTKSHTLVGLLRASFSDKNLPHINFCDSWTSSASKGMFTVQVIWAPKALLGLGLIKEERTFTHFPHKTVNVLNN